MEIVRRLRTERGWTQRKLAREARTSQHTIGEIELGLQDPHPTTLRKIAEALGVSEAQLSGEEPADSPLGPAQQRDSAVIRALITYFRDLRLRWKEPVNKPTPGQIRDAVDLLQHLADRGAFEWRSTSREQSEVKLLFDATSKLLPIVEELAKENEAAWLLDMIEEVFESASLGGTWCRRE